jgi:hypothetical protein
VSICSWPMPSTVTCCAPRPSNPRGAWLSLSPITPFNEVDNQTTAPDLSDGQVFHVMATGIGTTGQTISFGCTPDVTITGGQVAMADVAMTDLPLEFKGRFPRRQPLRSDRPAGKTAAIRPWPGSRKL